MLAYIWSQYKKDNSYIDVFWSLTFMTPLIALWILFGVQGWPILARPILTFVCVSIWGLRLSIYIGIRHNQEDFRYVEMRKNWMKHGLAFYYLMAFMGVFMF